MKKYPLILLLVFSQIVSASVPSTVTRQPSVPYLLEPYQFKTIEMSLFSSDITGMIIDDYGDLAWNPAFLSGIKQRKIYLDLDFSNSFQASQTYSYYNSNDYLVYPGWYQQTYISGVQTTPLYNLAVLLPISERLKIGIINRSNFDYGPFRETYYWDYYSWGSNSYIEDAVIAKDLEPQRLEVDDNQQMVYSIQTNLMLAYKITDRLNLGVKIGNYLFRRDGELYDSKWGVYPHSEFADLNDEELNIEGDQYTLGLGFLFHPNVKTTWGIFGEWINGKSSESSTSLDTSYSWSERDTDTDYFSYYDFDMVMNQKYSADANRKSINLTYEKKTSEKLTIRTFLRYSSVKSNIRLKSSSEDTTFSDRTYNTYDNSSYHFQRRISYATDRQHFQGDGETNSIQWNCFLSFIYRIDNDWSMFGGIQAVKYHGESEFMDVSDYYSSSQYVYQYYEPGSYEYLNTHEKYYEYTSESDQLSIHIPIGIKVQVVNGFYIIFASEMHYYLTDSQEMGRLLFPEVVSKKWEDNVIVVNDLEEDRYEEYSSEPAKDFSRNSNINLGFAYKHTSGINLYVRSVGNILETTGWDIGLEYQW